MSLFKSMTSCTANARLLEKFHKKKSNRKLRIKNLAIFAHKMFQSLERHHKWVPLKISSSAKELTCTNIDMHMTVMRLANVASYALDLFSKEGDLPAEPLYWFRPVQACEKRIVPATCSAVPPKGASCHAGLC